MIIIYNKKTREITGIMSGVSSDEAMISPEGKESEFSKYVVPVELEKDDAVKNPFDYKVKLNNRGVVIGFVKKS